MLSNTDEQPLDIDDWSLWVYTPSVRSRGASEVRQASAADWRVPLIADQTACRCSLSVISTEPSENDVAVVDPGRQKSVQ